MFDSVFPKAGFIYIAGDRIAASFIFCCGIFCFLSIDAKVLSFFAVYFTFWIFLYFSYFFLFLIVRCLNPVLKWNCFIVVFFCFLFFFLVCKKFIHLFAPKQPLQQHQQKICCNRRATIASYSHFWAANETETQIKLKMKKDTPECACKEPLLQHPLT